MSTTAGMIARQTADKIREAAKYLAEDPDTRLDRIEQDVLDRILVFPITSHLVAVTTTARTSDAELPQLTSAANRWLTAAIDLATDGLFGPAVEGTITDVEGDPLALAFWINRD